jgi:hypothetical protein
MFDDGAMKSLSATMPGRFAPAAALVALVVGLAGCDCEGRLANTTFITCGGYNGRSSISSPTFNLPPTVGVTSGISCLRQDLTCGGNGSVGFRATSRDVQGNELVLSISATPAAGPGTYALINEGPDVVIDATIYWEGDVDRTIYNAALIVRSGALVLTRNDTEHFSGTFTMVLEAPGQHQLSLTDGTFAVGPCSARTEEVCVVPHVD